LAVARTATITASQILEAARTVFLAHGFSATLVDVANAAGISSASIFKHFPSKEALFFAAMTEAPREGFWTASLEAAIGHGDPQADLLLIAQRIVAYASGLLPQMMLAWSVRQSEALKAGTVSTIEGATIDTVPNDTVPNAPNIQGDFASLAAYLGREMALGRIARGDPTVPALVLLHTASGFAMSLALQSSTRLFNANSFLEDFIAVLWCGLDPKAQAASQGRG
jgi:AcrR family transcriptional regulator